MDGFQTIEYSKDAGIAYIWLDRPQVLNAYNTTMRDELYQALEAVREDDEVLVAVLRGRGRAFCAGADLGEFGTAPSQAVARQVRWERDVWGAFLSLRMPLICGIQGHCIGSGVEMALLCDLRVASDDATFAMPEVLLGMIPAAGGTQTLPRAIGTIHALDLLLTGKRLDALEALRLGLVGQVVPSERLDEEVEALASQIASMNPVAVAAAKEAVRDGAEMPIASGLEMEKRLATQVMRGGR